MLKRRKILAEMLLLVGVGLSSGCGETGAPLPLDEERARKSVEKAMEAWKAGKTPADLQPEITIGDPAWNSGRKLASFEILRDKETSDGSNLHIRVKRSFADSGANSESETIYIVGTSPVITIFPR